MLARTRVCLTCPLPPPLATTTAEDGQAGQQGTHDNDHWKPLFDILANAPGCKSVACSRIAEEPETALFAIIWRAQTDVDIFSTSPAYDSFLAALGSPAAAVQTVKVTAHTAVSPLTLQSWLSFFTITLPHPVTDAQREVYARMRGPAYPWYHAGMDPAMKAALMTMPAPSRAPDVQYGWALAPQEEDGGTGRQVQDGVFYRKWLSSEAEQEWRTWIPGVVPDWQKELSEIGAVGAKEEHVDLVYVARFTHNYCRQGRR
ncbi:hypothetical protein V8F06_010560 [Rhypophila decipiens]